MAKKQKLDTTTESESQEPVETTPEPEVQAPVGQTFSVPWRQPTFKTDPEKIAMAEKLRALYEEYYKNPQPGPKTPRY